MLALYRICPKIARICTHPRPMIISLTHKLVMLKLGRFM
jgi:hypothetical protein